MAITYGSAAGTIITSFLVTQALGDQSQQTNNNTIILDDNPSAATGYGGDVGNGTLGTGDSYVNRRIMIGRGSTIQERIVISETTGTGNTFILTVHEDWDTNPVATTDTVDVYYELADVEEGGGGGGISLAARTGLWTLTRIITMGNGTDPAGLSMHGGQALECADRSAADSFLVENNGFFRFGYYSGGLPISGGVIAITAATDDEPAQSFVSGSDSVFLDTLIWAQVATLSQISPTGASVVYDGVKLLKTTQECELYGDTITDLSIAGEAKTTEIVRVDSATSCNAFVMVDVQVLDSEANTTTETITLTGVVFSGVAGYVDVRQNKTWNLIDPIWDVTTYTDLTWTGTSTGNELNDKRSVTVTAQKADGTLLQDAVVNVYEHTQLLDLVVKTSTDVNGLASDSFIYQKHATNSATTTYGGHALQCNKWLYLPFVAAQAADVKFSGSIVLADDNNIVETTQATAITAGSGITWNEDANVSEIFDFTLGTGTLAAGMIITFTSGAVGTITDSLSGDSIAGEIHLKDRNATAITNGDTFSRTGGTAGTFTGTYTNDTKQPFAIWIEGNSLSYQTIYDYIAALTTETTLSATGEIIWEWCRSTQSQALYNTGSSFYTEQSNSKGIIIVSTGAGTVDYMTDDAGNTWIPPSSTTLTLTGIPQNSEVTITELSAGADSAPAAEVHHVENISVSGQTQYAYTTSGVLVDIIIQHVDYDINLMSIYNFTLSASDASIPITVVSDPNYNNP